ncbi:hypothetical protein FGO68_gene2291 [Halteria grandinella]|uniref:Cystatin domain-containing protein n=1 Tax=Halteria grandinella TaxID=5974 RepID=A0A8J8SYI7_HALGN|nr:hypothetical protein FGO68_gene2291 [Halteria grandinella]
MKWHIQNSLSHTTLPTIAYILQPCSNIMNRQMIKSRFCQFTQLLFTRRSALLLMRIQCWNFNQRLLHELLIKIMSKLIVLCLLLVIVTSRIDAQDPHVGKKNYSSNKQESDVMKYRRAAALAKEEFQSINYFILDACGLNGYQWKQNVGVQTQVVSGFDYVINGKVAKGDSVRTVSVTVYVPAGQDGRLHVVGCTIIA